MRSLQWAFSDPGNRENNAIFIWGRHQLSSSLPQRCHEWRPLSSQSWKGPSSVLLLIDSLPHFNTATVWLPSVCLGDTTAKPPSMVMFRGFVLYSLCLRDIECQQHLPFWPWHNNCLFNWRALYTVCGQTTVHCVLQLRNWGRVGSLADVEKKTRPEMERNYLCFLSHGPL